MSINFDDLLVDLDLSKYSGGTGGTITTVRPREGEERWRREPLTGVSSGIMPFFGTRFVQKTLPEVSDES